MIEIKNEKYYTAKEVSEKFGITMSRVSQLRLNCQLKFFRIGKRKFLYSETNLEDFVKNAK